MGSVTERVLCSSFYNLVATVAFLLYRWQSVEHRGLIFRWDSLHQLVRDTFSLCMYTYRFGGQPSSCTRFPYRSVDSVEVK